MTTKLLPLFVWFALGTGVTSLRAQDWPAFRGPTGDGQVDAAAKMPMTWDKEKNVAWRSDLPGKGWSTPVVIAGKIYLTTAVTSGDEDDPKSDRSLRALCVDAANGKVLWNVEVFPQNGAGAPSIHSKNSHASPTPVIEKDRIYVHFGHQGTACLDLTGKKIWEQRSLKYTPVHGGGATPLLVDGLLIFPCDGGDKPFIAALKADTGEVAWNTPRGGGAKKTFSFASPECITVEGKKQIISPCSDALRAYDPATGKEIWYVKYDGYSVIPKPLFGHGMLYFSTGYDDPVTYAVRPGGEGDLTSKNVVWTQSKRAPNTPSMLMKGDELYTVADNGIVSCLDAKTGEIHWQERTARGCSASPLLHGEHLYILDEYGTTTILRAGRTFEKVAENKLDGERTLASPSAADGALFIRTEKALFRIQE